jgi:hypothetical protein
LEKWWVLGMKKLMSKLSIAFERWFESNEKKALEDYLSKSQNISDLETRMRNWQYTNTSRKNFLPY